MSLWDLREAIEKALPWWVPVVPLVAGLLIVLVTQIVKTFHKEKR